MMAVFLCRQVPSGTSEPGRWPQGPSFAM